MPLSEDAMKHKTQYNIEYAKKKYKRVPLDLTHEKYDEVVAAAALSGETVNGFIKAAIEARLNSNK